MKINTKVHALLDYLFSFALILPWFINFCSDKISVDLLALTGVFNILLSQLTNYEYGLIRLIPMQVRVDIDMCVAAFLLSLPFIFNYPDYWPIGFALVHLFVAMNSELLPKSNI